MVLHRSQTGPRVVHYGQFVTVPLAPSFKPKPELLSTQPWETTMSETTTQRLEDFMEDEAGCRHFRAVDLADLQGACERVYGEESCDPDADPDLLAALKLIKDYEFRV